MNIDVPAIVGALPIDTQLHEGTLLNALTFTWPFLILAMQETRLRLCQLTTKHIFVPMYKLTMQSESVTTRRLMVSVTTVYLLLSCIAQYEKDRMY